jgi:hypothetical protein
MSDVEKENLAAHVELCSERYATLERRLSAVERKLDDIVQSADQTKILIMKSIGVATGIISVVVSVTIVILGKIN